MDRNFIAARRYAILLLLPLWISACATPAGPAVSTPISGASAEDAEKFVAEAERRRADYNLRANRVAWINATYITDDTDTLAAESASEGLALTDELARGSRRFDGVAVKPETARKLLLLKLAFTDPAPSDASARAELSKLVVSMQSDYGKGKYCPHNDQTKCMTLGDMEKILADSRDPAELKKVWLGWHKVSLPMRDRYARFVELSNQGAREMGFANTGDLWRAQYEMSPASFSAETERLWQQVKPLYDSLYIYVRHKLADKYGEGVVPRNGPIPAHLLGNMWSQQWGNIFPLVKPAGAAGGYDLTAVLKSKNTTPQQLVKFGEGFFTSLGFPALPHTFWQRSLLVKPQDREVVCHASAWNLDARDDLRIKMCIEINAEDFYTVHHELGHNYYQRAYNRQPELFRGGANDGFHEAIGDTVALSVTPDYLQKIGLIDTAPDAANDTGWLLEQALDKIAFLPFGYLIDQWRWKVFAGEVTPQDYDKLWWELREKYQGIARPEPIHPGGFDAGAKYHIAANTPYMRYFIAHVMQYQFHRALCREAGYQGPLHRCSIYGSKAAGDKLMAMLEKGQSQPWLQTMKSLTGEESMDASAILDYYAPLKRWLDQQNSTYVEKRLIK
ncbi:MAG: M2 family metallopeptidase [Burkholderiales bacterium]